MAPAGHSHTRQRLISVKRDKNNIPYYFKSMICTMHERRAWALARPTLLPLPAAAAAAAALLAAGTVTCRKADRCCNSPSALMSLAVCPGRPPGAASPACPACQPDTGGMLGRLVTSDTPTILVGCNICCPQKFLDHREGQLSESQRSCSCFRTGAEFRVSHLGYELVALMPQLLPGIFVYLRYGGHTAHRLRSRPRLARRCACRCLTSFKDTLHIRQVDALHSSYYGTSRYISITKAR